MSFFVYFVPPNECMLFIARSLYVCNRVAEWFELNPMEWMGLQSVCFPSCPSDEVTTWFGDTDSNFFYGLVLWFDICI